MCGFAVVFLDGALAGTVDTYAATRPAASEPLFSAGGLPAGSHTLTIQVTGTQNIASGGAYVLVDAFDVEGAPPPGGTAPRRIEEDDPSVTYAGSWLVQRRSDLSGGSIVESSDPNGSASLRFDGTEVAWIGFKAPWAGIAEVYVDGTLRATVDTYSPIEQSQALVYAAGGLPAGPHTLKIKITGAWNSSGCCSWIVVDAFDVQ